MACRSHDSGRSAPKFDLCAAAHHEARVVPFSCKVATFQTSFLLEGPPKITDRVALPLVDDAVARGRRRAGALFYIFYLETGLCGCEAGLLRDELGRPDGVCNLWCCCNRTRRAGERAAGDA